MVEPAPEPVAIDYAARPPVTAAEAPQSSERADATVALNRAPLPRHSLPREAKLLAGSVALLAALLAIPSPDRSGATEDPVLKALSLEEARKLAALAHLDVRFEEMKDLWRSELHRVGEVLDARLKHLEER